MEGPLRKTDKIARRLRFTKQLFFGDMLFNWFLGALLTAAPGFVDRLLTTIRFFPLIVFRLIGIGFLIYSAWQTFIIVKDRRSTSPSRTTKSETSSSDGSKAPLSPGAFTPSALKGAASAAFGPVVILTVGLVLWGDIIAPFWTVLLWIGDVYMLVLGIWYLRLAKSQAR